LNVTTTAHGEAARLVDQIAHRHADGRWLATGGGGYDAYRVVPRTWALTWLAGAHRDVPESTPAAWRDRWAHDGARYGQSPPPGTFQDEPNAGIGFDANQEAAENRALMMAASLEAIVVPRLLIDASLQGWWDPLALRRSSMPTNVEHSDGEPEILASVDAGTWSRLSLPPSVIPPADPITAHALVATALAAKQPARVSAAVVGANVVSLAISGPIDPKDGRRYLLAIGTTPEHRRKGLATRLLAVHVDGPSFAPVSLAERDPFDPLPRDVRAGIARRLLSSAGYRFEPWQDAQGRHSIDPGAFVGRFQ